MMTVLTRLCPNEEEVAAKVMDGEAILINLSNGMYYSMDKVGGLIWEMIEANHNLEEIVATIIVHYDVSPKQVQADVERLATELIEENLVKISDNEAPRGKLQQREPQQKLPYESPQLNVYRDMADLLALDPPMPGLGDLVWKKPDDESPQ